ncbi:hypothetical protein BZA05DRAFT_86302 [Tricharina praecox]|uniref:uncharacterized protein n=1 Tax=Tricharina praecox TaxID=43433 RepID=UPI00221F8A4E|nr:uncharacterized protein BZA05DRAFT_86302 [Tricharina praecox]KAI5849222.1 hypothetical protein BZA05DRAFT_86302 [Tricharina praecox]
MMAGWARPVRAEGWLAAMGWYGACWGMDRGCMLTWHGTDGCSSVSCQMPVARCQLPDASCQCRSGRTTDVLDSTLRSYSTLSARETPKCRVLSYLSFLTSVPPSPCPRSIRLYWSPSCLGLYYYLVLSTRIPNRNGNISTHIHLQSRPQPARRPPPPPPLPPPLPDPPSSILNTETRAKQKSFIISPCPTVCSTTLSAVVTTINFFFGPALPRDCFGGGGSNFV